MLAPASVGAQGASFVDTAAFVTRLGADTVAVEQFIHRPGRMEAHVVLRAPTTTRTRYTLETDSVSQLVRYGTVTRSAAGERWTAVTRFGDSLRIVVADTGAPRTRTIAASALTLPFIDMVHWPYELVLMRARVTGADSFTQPLLTGNQTSDFRVARVGADSMTITHPFRGTMRVRIDARGRLLGLDAAGTTRKLVVERTSTVPLDDAFQRWSALDAAGRSFGALSGRGEARASVGAATVVIDYGTPAKRGRPIWGALVPYGQVWRTGANLATHLTTDRDLVLGSGAQTLAVPAGRYTLFSIPDANGGTLIVNRQTDQGGTTYDQTQDLGRVRLTPRQLKSPVEQFTIAVVGGELRLRWDRTELTTPIRTR